MKKPSLRKVRKPVIIAAVAAAAFFLLANRFGHGGTSHDNPVVFGPQQTITATTPDDGTVPFTAAPATSSAGPAPGSKPSSSPPAGNDDGDDGGDDPVFAQPTTRPDVNQTAADFAAAWLNTYGQSADSWRENVIARVTDDVAADLAEADPHSVPRAAMTGNVTATRQGDLLGADVTVLTADTKRSKLGVLKLEIVEVDGRMLISSIDWEPKP